VETLVMVVCVISLRESGKATVVRVDLFKAATTSNSTRKADVVKERDGD
jgi:hypothetical protein